MCYSQIQDRFVHERIQMDVLWCHQIDLFKHQNIFCSANELTFYIFEKV